MSELRERGRRERIRILLKTRNDYLPAPRASTSSYSISGVGEGKARKCPACEGTGRVRAATRHLRAQVCPSCEGEKTIKVDSYVGRVSSDRHTARSTPQVIDAEIQRLQSYRHREAGGQDPNESYGWEKAKESRDRQGSYKELELALERLRASDYDGWTFLLGIYNYPRPLSREAEIRSDALVGALSQFMPAKIRLPRALHAELMERKHKRARALLKDGLDVAAVSVAVLLPERVVQAL